LLLNIILCSNASYEASLSTNLILAIFKAFGIITYQNIYILVYICCFYILKTTLAVYENKGKLSFLALSVVFKMLRNAF